MFLELFQQLVVHRWAKRREKKNLNLVERAGCFVDADANRRMLSGFHGYRVAARLVGAAASHQQQADGEKGPAPWDTRHATAPSG